MKLGDMLECVMADRVHLTVGKFYRVLEFGDTIFITMENDDGVPVQYARERFRIPSEIRQCVSV